MLSESHDHPAAVLRRRRLQRRGLWASLGLLALGSLAIFLSFLTSLGPGSPLSSGRLVDAGPVSAFRVRQPQVFVQSDFSLLKLDDGSFFAPYIYPPGFLGHLQGCTIRWMRNYLIWGDVWVEGCGGAKWNRAGQRLFGPTPRDLDHFAVTVQGGRVYVNTRRLICSGTPCERVHDLAVRVAVTATDHGFSPSTLTVPAGKPVLMVFDNEAQDQNNWHVLGTVNGYAKGLGLTPNTSMGTIGAPGIGTVVSQPGSQSLVIFRIDEKGTYRFQSDANPTTLKGSLRVR